MSGNGQPELLGGVAAAAGAGHSGYCWVAEEEEGRTEIT